MSEITISKLSELNDDHKESAMELFLDGFGHLFSSLTKDREILKDLFTRPMDFSAVSVALYENNIVGFIAVANNKKRPMNLDVGQFKKLFGNFRGALIYKSMSAGFEKPAVSGDRDLYIDFLVTDKNYRGKGIATKLIDAVCDTLEYDECYIEVLSKNSGAKKLYEYLGFVVCKKTYSLFTILSGWGYPIKLKCPIVEGKLKNINHVTIL